MAGSTAKIPAGCHTLTPHIIVRGAAEAIDFYKKAFGARELRRMPGPDGKSIMFAEIQIGDSRLFLNDEAPHMGALSPAALKGTPVTIHMYAENPDAVFEQATKAGANVLMPLADMFWGDRYGLLADPYGHQWAIACHVRDVTPEEMAKAAAAMFGDAGGKQGAN